MMTTARLPIADAAVWRRKAGVYLLTLLCVLVSGVSAVTLLAVFINWTDEELAPQTSCFLGLSDTYQVSDSANSFYILKAINADAGEDALTAGMRQVEAEDKIYHRNPAAFFNLASNEVYRSAVPGYSGIPACDENEASCIPFYLRYRGDWQRWRLSQPLLSQRFDQMLRLGYYSEQMSPAFVVSRHHERLLADALQQSLLQALFQAADGDADAALERLQLQDQWLRRVLANSRSITLREIAISALFSQMRLLNDMLDAYPVLMQEHQQILINLTRPLNPSEKNLVPVFEAEAHRMLMNMHLNPDYWDSTSPKKRSTLEKLIYQASFQPQATMNRTAAYWSQQIQEASKPAPALIAERKDEKKHRLDSLWDEAERYLKEIYNPDGLQFLQRYASDPVNRMTNALTDIDSYLRLTGLKLMLIAQKIPDSQILGTVAQAEIRYRNPADNSAMQWNPRKRTLSFNALQAQTNANAGTMAAVSVRIPLPHYAQSLTANP